MSERARRVQRHLSCGAQVLLCVAVIGTDLLLGLWPSYDDSPEIQDELKENTRKWAKDISEQVVHSLRKAEDNLASGSTVAEATRELA